MAKNRELTDREREILELVATGASNRQIAGQLHISSNTVKVHLRNIFEKLGVSSRTEAALYAIQQGWVEGVESTFVTPARPWWQRGWVVGGGVLVLMMVALLIGLLVNRGGPPPENLVDLEQLERERWQALAPMPTARKGLAVAAYDGKIYAIAGETADGVTDVVERYDPATDSWETLPPKPTAVTDVHAVVIGGEIFVPGGNEADGNVSDVLEIFDPSLGTWIARALLPEPLTRYAIVAYEGRMILFGGWNGEELIDKVYEYDPLDDTWEIIATIKEPRGDARAVVSGNQIYLLGGHDNNHVLKNLDLYVASAEVNGESRWTSLEPLPMEKTSFQVTEIADVIYVIGGDEEEGFIQQYLTRSNEWRVSDELGILPISRQGIQALDDYIYIIGGEREGAYLSSTYRYRAIYTIFLPVSTNQ